MVYEHIKEEEGRKERPQQELTDELQLSEAKKAKKASLYETYEHITDVQGVEITTPGGKKVKIKGEDGLNNYRIARAALAMKNINDESVVSIDVFHGIGHGIVNLNAEELDYCIAAAAEFGYDQYFKLHGLLEMVDQCEGLQYLEAVTW